MSKMIADAITLKCGDWECDIYPALAANAIRLEWRGMPVLRTLPDLETWGKLPCVHGTPVLLPANRTAGGQFTFEGTTYQLPVNEVRNNNNLHGRLHSQVFTVVEQSETSTLCHYENKGDIYPFPFTADFSAELSEEGLFQKFVFTNIGDRAMPMTFAIHTAFAEQDSFSVPLKERWVLNECAIPTGELVPLSDIEKQWCIRGISKEQYVNGFFTSAGQTVTVGDFRYTVSETFDQWILYNGNGKQEFVCLEPQCGPTNGLNMENGFRVIQPGESITFTTMLSRK